MATTWTQPLDSVVGSDHRGRHALAFVAATLCGARILCGPWRTRPRYDPTEKLGKLPGRPGLRPDGALLVEEVREVSDVHRARNSTRLELIPAVKAVSG